MSTMVGVMRRNHGRTPRKHWSVPANGVLVFCTYLALSLSLHAAVFGDWTFEVDDQFYALVGHRLTEGARLYVDIWARKGPVLYFLYALFAWLWGSPICYQLAATLFCVVGAIAIQGLAARLVDRRGAFLAGVSYLLLSLQFGGANGQSVVFYEPMLAICAWSVVSHLDVVREGRVDLRLAVGFLAAGLALMCKQSAAFEALFFGAAYCVLAWRAGASPTRLIRSAAVLALVGAAPFMTFLFGFWASGHFESFWHALIGSNLERQYMDAHERWNRLPAVLAVMALPMGLALLGWLSLRRSGRDNEIGFILGWLGAAMLGVLVYPNIFQFYLMALVPALCVLASGLYRERLIGLLALGGLAVSILPFSSALDLPLRNQARAASAQLVDYVRRQKGQGGLFVAGQLSYLYVLTESPPPSSLVFVSHLFDMTEASAIGRNQFSEVKNILAQRPGIVVRQDPMQGSPLNARAVALLDAYLAGCSKYRRFTLYDQYGVQGQVVYSQCRRSTRPAN